MCSSLTLSFETLNTPQLFTSKSTQDKARHHRRWRSPYLCIFHQAQWRVETCALLFFLCFFNFSRLFVYPPSLPLSLLYCLFRRGNVSQFCDTSRIPTPLYSIRGVFFLFFFFFVVIVSKKRCSIRRWEGENEGQTEGGEKQGKRQGWEGIERGRRRGKKLNESHWTCFIHQHQNSQLAERVRKGGREGKKASSCPH